MRCGYKGFVGGGRFPEHSLQASQRGRQVWAQEGEVLGGTSVRGLSPMTALEGVQPSEWSPMEERGLGLRKPESACHWGTVVLQ